MRFVAFERNGTRGLAMADQVGRHWGLDDGRTHGGLEGAVAGGSDGLKDLAAALLKGKPIDPEAVTFLPPLSSPSKIICVGLNYADHAAESSIQQPDYPTLFGRFSSSLIGHGAPDRATECVGSARLRRRACRSHRARRSPHPQVRCTRPVRVPPGKRLSATSTRLTREGE